MSEKSSTDYSDIEEARYNAAYQDFRKENSSFSFKIPTKKLLYAVNQEWMRGTEKNRTISLIWDDIENANKLAVSENKKVRGYDFGDFDQGSDEDNYDIPYNVTYKDGMFSCLTPVEGSRAKDSSMISVDFIQSTHMLRFCARRQLLRCIKAVDESNYTNILNRGSDDDMKECILRYVHDEQLTLEQWQARLNPQTKADSDDQPQKKAKIEETSET